VHAVRHVHVPTKARSGSGGGSGLARRCSRSWVASNVARAAYATKLKTTTARHYAVRLCGASFVVLRHTSRETLRQQHPRYVMRAVAGGMLMAWIDKLNGSRRNVQRYRPRREWPPPRRCSRVPAHLPTRGFVRHRRAGKLALSTPVSVMRK